MSKLDRADWRATLACKGTRAELMNEAHVVVTGDERLSWNEIRGRFPDEWVVLVDADWADDHNFEFGTARVFAHRKGRREATTDLGAACREFENVGCFFTGQIWGPMPRFGLP